MTSPQLMTSERARLTRITDTDVIGVRQHFLRMRPGLTQRAMAEAGFSYDATAGFPDRNGFRLGVADVVPTWDEGARRALDLEQVPLTWMDRALSKYQRRERPASWIEDAIEIAARCRAVEGLWVGLWHPNLTPPLGFPGAPAAYERLLSTILADEPYVDTLAEIVGWRRARRRLRVRRVAPDGRAIELIAAEGSAKVRLEPATASSPSAAVSE
jgi:hypothetical protein